MRKSMATAAQYCFAAGRLVDQLVATAVELLTQLQARHRRPTQLALVEVYRFKREMLLEQVLLRGEQVSLADLPLAAEQPEMQNLLEADVLALQVRRGIYS